MFNLTLGRYVLSCGPDGLPDRYGEYCAHAILAEEIDLDRPGGRTCFVAVTAGAEWPFLVLAQRYDLPGREAAPGAMIVPETDLLFVGAGTRLLAYDLKVPGRLWEGLLSFSFRGWQRHWDFVVMASERELAAWDLYGRKKWSARVEPPWSYRVERNEVHVDMRGQRFTFPVSVGPVDRSERPFISG